MSSEKKIVSVASYGRIESLVRTLESIIDQCDVLNVVLNSEINELPKILFDNKINLVFSDNSYGDAMKFLFLEESEGYYLTIDDDIIYPPNYVEFMISKCKDYNNSRVITLHGRSFKTFPIVSYYRSATERYSCFGNVKHDVNVQFGGTGVMCFHTDLFKISVNYFRAPNMADVWIGKYCMENNIGILCAKHEAGYINYINQDSTIYDTYSKGDNLQTLVANSTYDKTIQIDFNSVNSDNQNVVDTNTKDQDEKLEPVKSTIERSQKTINYEKINQIFSKTPSHIAVKPKNIGVDSSLKTNSSVLVKLNKIRGRR